MTPSAIRNCAPFGMMAARIRDIFPKKNRTSPDDKLLAALIAEKTLTEMKKKIPKFDGRPISRDEICNSVN